jgi:hypothetical protein
MMRVNLKGINRVKKRLADGTFATYYYAWKGGPRLTGEFGSPEFLVSYKEAVDRRKAPAQGVLLGVLNRYERSTEFLDLADSMRRSYIPLIKRIERSFADFH